MSVLEFFIIMFGVGLIPFQLFYLSIYFFAQGVAQKDNLYKFIAFCFFIQAIAAVLYFYYKGK